jgi:uncharacterized protein
MPMFPLGSALLPGAVLPLHIFEPRYRQMIQDCLADESHEFGVVLIQRGNEVGGGDDRANFGTVARMVQVAEMPDGRYAVISVGVRRIAVRAWLPDDPYPVADVDDWPDGGDAVASTPSSDWPIERRSALAQRARRANALASELGDAVGDVSLEVDDDLELASYQLAQLAPLNAHDRHQLLAVPAASDRLSLLESLLGDVEAVLAFRLNAGSPDDSDIPPA